VTCTVPTFTIDTGNSHTEHGFKRKDISQRQMQKDYILHYRSIKAQFKQPMKIHIENYEGKSIKESGQEKQE